MKKFNLAAVVAVLLAAILSLALPLSAADLPEPNDDFYVLDQSGILSTDTKDYIIAQNKLLYDATGAQIVVLTEDFVPDGKLELYAYNIFNKWESARRTKATAFCCSSLSVTTTTDVCRAKDSKKR